jgi:hypothetical protein
MCMTISFQDIHFLFWIPFIWTLCTLTFIEYNEDIRILLIPLVDQLSYKKIAINIVPTGLSYGTAF